MASIALFDIDFWYGRKQYPNLELMKTFNYYYSQNHIIVFVKPNQSLEKYDRVFYFFENTNILLPKQLNILNEKSQCYGSGFYGNFRELISPINNSIPSYLPYDLEENNIKNIKLYNQIKKNSLIRLENLDFSGFNSKSKYIYLVDHDVLYKDFENFAIEYDKYYYRTFYPLKIYTEEKLFQIEKYSEKFKTNRFIIDFIPNKELYTLFSNKNFIYTFKNLTEKNNQLKCIRTFLYLKSKNIKPYFKIFEKIPKKIIPIFDWYSSGERSSYYEYIQNKPNLLNDFNENFSKDSDYRLLLKTNPKKINDLTFTI